MATAKATAKANLGSCEGRLPQWQYTLPLKEKQIQQTKLEAEARKGATIQNAEAEPRPR